jgi:hypothetical protein
METIGVLFFFFIFGMAFWILIFLSLFIGAWLSLLGLEKISPSLVENILGHKQSSES